MGLLIGSFFLDGFGDWWSGLMVVVLVVFMVVWV